MIPNELKQKAQWVVYRLEERDGRVTKVPYSVSGKRASTTDATTWATFAQAAAVKEDYSGVGFVFAGDYVGIDLDKCRNPQTGDVQQWASDAVKELDSYTELSQSGTGFHIIVRGALPAGGNRRGQVEMYAKARYFVMTDKHVADTPNEIAERDLTAFHTRYIVDAPTDVDLSLEEYKQALDIVQRIGFDLATVEAEFRRTVQHRDKHDKNRTYVARTCEKAIAEIKSRNVQPAKQANNIINGRQLVVTNLSDYPIEPIIWLWKNKIPKGSLALFSGPAGVGKTLVLLDVIARYTTGKDWPDGSVNAVEKGEVLLLNAEDHVKQSLHPRLIAAGFSHGSVHILDGTVLAKDAKKKKRSIALDNDLELIESFLKENPQVGLIVIDPISNYIGEKNMNNSQAVRSVLTPVGDLAEKLGVTVLCNSHFNKSKRGDTTALAKIGGASALHEIPRAVWEFGRDEEDKKLFHFVCAKGNETGSKKGLSYRIGGKTVQHKNVTCEDIGFICWGDEEELDADEVFSDIPGGDEGSDSKVDACKTWLLSFITSEKPSSEVFAVGASKGFPERTVYRAKGDLRDDIKAVKRRDGWYWRRTVTINADFETVHPDAGAIVKAQPQVKDLYS